MESSISARLKAIRKHLKLSQLEISTKLGIGRSYWASLESGHREPTRKTLLLLSETLNVSADWVLNRGGEMFNANTSTNKDFVTNEVHKLALKLEELYSMVVLLIEIREQHEGIDGDFDSYLKKIGEIALGSGSPSERLKIHSASEVEKLDFIKNASSRYDLLLKELFSQIREVHRQTLKTYRKKWI